MARPIKDNADYFSHDADMRNDARIKAIRRKYGLEGYALWNMLLEHLTDCDFFEYEWNDLNIELLSGDFDCDPNFLKEFVNYCTNTLDLFQVDNLKLSSFTHRKRFNSLLSKRKRDRNGVFASDNTQSKVKESKEEKSKENTYREFDHLKLTHNQFTKLKSTYSKSQIDSILDSIENYSKNKNYKNLYLTAIKWLKKEYPEVKPIEPDKQRFDLRCLGGYTEKVYADTIEEAKEILSKSCGTPIEQISLNK